LNHAAAGVGNSRMIGGWIGQRHESRARPTRPRLLPIGFPEDRD
jgi:hypothetical protein